MMTNKQDELIPVWYSCYEHQTRDGEQFISDHLFSYQIAGTLIVNDGHAELAVKEGDFIFCRRNSLVKAVKQPPEKGDYEALTLFLNQDALQNFGKEFGYSATRLNQYEPIIKLGNNALYKSYMDSLQPYKQLQQRGNEALFSLKLKEGIMLLLKYNPELRNYLFDFSEPGKLDLEKFMNNNFRFNVDMQKFAYLTGRSLATFKRDFTKTFNTTPGRWLQQTRLEEAYYLIKEKKRRPSDVYIEVGFETIAHFSFAFKQFFGVNPSSV